MATYDEIRKSIELIRTNKVGDKLLSIRNIADHFKYRLDDVRTVVQELIGEGTLRFRNTMIKESSKTYDTEYLEVIKKRIIHKKDNSWKYGI